MHVQNQENNCQRRSQSDTIASRALDLQTTCLSLIPEWRQEKPLSTVRCDPPKAGKNNKIKIIFYILIIKY